MSSRPQQTEMSVPDRIYTRYFEELQHASPWGPQLVHQLQQFQREGVLGREAVLVNCYERLVRERP